MDSGSTDEHTHTEKKKGGIPAVYRDFGPYLTLGFQLAAAVVIFFFLGDWVDNHFGIAPIGKLAGAFIGMIGGFIKFFKSVASLTAQEDRNRVSKKRED